MRLSSILIMLLALTSTPASAVTEAQFDTIRNLGRLNGVALHCDFLEETKRMKEALVDTLPKRRELGLAFDEVTNESFLSFIEEELSCPTYLEFNNLLDEAIEALKAAF